MKNHLQKFFAHSAMYMASSVDAVTAFRMAARRIKYKTLAQRVNKALSMLDAGLPVSEAFKVFREKKHLDGVAWAILSSADKAGSMRSACEHISAYMKASAKIQKSFVSALAYPTGVIVMASAMVYFLLTYIFPKITPLFKSLNAPMPPTTALLIFISDILRHYSLHIGLGTIAVLAAFAYLYKSEKAVSGAVHFVFFKIPFVRSLVFAKESHVLALSCGVLMRSGRNLAESVLAAKESAGNSVMREYLEQMLAELESGKPLSEILASKPAGRAGALYSLFQDEWLDLITVGEKTGNLPKACIEIAECYEGRLKDTLELAARVAEPAALAVSAGIILVVAMSVIQPMYAILNYVHS